VPLQRTRCWNCSLLERIQVKDSNGYIVEKYRCPRNALLPRMLEPYFAEKCTLFKPKKQQNHASDISHNDVRKESMTKKNIASPTSRIRKYRLSQDLSQLPRMRISASHKIEKRLVNKFRKILIQRLGEVPYDAMTKFRFESEDLRFLPYEEALETVKALAEDIIRREEAKLPHLRLTLPKPRYKRPKYSELIEDRNIFSENELLMEGYCEECLNYGKLVYINGLYLCESCRESLRTSYDPSLDQLWDAILKGLDVFMSF